jgi:hypothetical protein
VPAPAFVEALRPADWPVRTVRAVATALACVAIAALGHLTAGGALPSGAVIAVFAGAVAVAWVLSARRVTPSQLVGLLLLCQVCVHLGASTGTMTMSAAMLASHALATVLSALVLARGEAFVWQLADRLGLRVLPTGLRVLPMPFWSRPTPVFATRSLHDVRLAHSRVERGPPSGL